MYEPEHDVEEILHQLQKHIKHDSTDYLKLTDNDLLRLAKYIDKNIFKGNECVLWKGYINQQGYKTQYAKISYKGKKVLLHRLLYHNFINSITDDDEIIYLCGNRGKCCLIKHLQLRVKIPRIQPAPKIPGERRKLTREQALAIYNDYLYSRKIDLARKYNVSIATVNNIIQGKTYTDFTGSDGNIHCLVKKDTITLSFTD